MKIDHLGFLKVGIPVFGFDNQVHIDEHCARESEFTFTKRTRIFAVL